MGEITKKRLIAYYIVSAAAIIFAIILMESEKVDSGLFSGFLIGFGPAMFIFTLAYHWKYYRKFGRFF
jgi:hypothetical protein